ncbi:MAG TPA: hypothetical protein VGM62_10750 [Chthoniobacterales bacterium]
MDYRTVCFVAGRFNLVTGNHAPTAQAKPAVVERFPRTPPV